MLNDYIRSCYLMCLVDRKFSPKWIVECDWINRFTHCCSLKPEMDTFLYLSLDGKKVLYATKHILAFDEDTGLPWANRYKEKITILPEKELKSKYLYAGLFVSEYVHPRKLITLREHMKLQPFSAAIILKYIDKIIDMTSIHMLPLCFSEDLLLVDVENEDILCCSYNYIVDSSHPITDIILTLFHKRVHPYLLSELDKKKAVSSIIPPARMKKYCANVIEKEARKDIKLFMFSLVYFLGSIATYWKLGIRWPYSVKKNNKKIFSSFKCSSICQHSKYSMFEDIRDKIHNYMCEMVLRRLPTEICSSTQPIYVIYKHILSDLKSFIESLD